MANRSVLRSTLLLSRAHLLLLLRHNNNKPSLLSNPLFQDSSLQTLKPFSSSSSSSSSSSCTITNHNHLFFSPSRSFCSFFEPDNHKYPMAFDKNVKLDSSSAITQGESIVKRKPGRPRKIRPVVVDVDETVSLTSPPSLSSLSQTQKRGRGRPPGSGKKKVVALESSPVSSLPSLSLSQTPETQKRDRGRPTGSGKKKVVELESSPVSSLSQTPETQKRGRGRPPGSGKKKEVELESSPVSSLPSLSLSQAQKRGRGRPPGSGKKNEMLKQQSLKEEWGEQWLKNRREELELMDQREEQKLEQQQGLKKLEYYDFEQALLMDQREERKLTEQQGLKKRYYDFERSFLESMAFVAHSNNMLNPWEDFNKVKNKRDLPDLDISFCYLDEDCLIIE